MTIFETVKTTVTPRQAAEFYGFTVGKNGMTCCPFHNDRHPSMKLNDTYYYCFGCGANGDVIDFTAKLFRISNSDAAQKLAQDFGISAKKPSIIAKLKHYETLIEQEKHCFRVLSDYLYILKDWQKQYSPKTPEEEPDTRFVEACHMLECTQYMVDCLTTGDSEERRELVADMMKDDKIKLLAERVSEIRENANGEK